VKIALFYHKNNHEEANEIGSLISGKSCGIEYHEISVLKNSDCWLNPLTLLDKATHFLFLYSKETTDLSTFIFYAGFCLGRGIPIVVLELDARMPIPENSRQLGTLLQKSSFEAFFIAEQTRYLAEDKKNRARNELLERGISCFDENFMLIVSSGDAEAVALFLEAGFNPALADSRGTPLLSLAVRAQFPRVANLLLDAGADVNKQSGDRGYSPLMDAVQKGDVAMVKLLLEHGAVTDQRSKDGQTALIICAGRGDEDMAEFLVMHGADPQIKDNLGMSAAGYAKLFNNRKMMELFNPAPA